MKMKPFTIAMVLCSQITLGWAQLTLDDCQTKALSNYPLVKQFGLIEQAEHYSLVNANKGYLPQLALTAKATYQSDVTELPIAMPGVKPLSKNQYQAVAELSQTLWDGGAIGAQKQIAASAATVDQQKNEVDLYALRERVNQLYFGILLLREQLKQNEILGNELQTNFDKVSAYMQNGVANQSDLDAVKVEQLRTKQRLAELTAAHKSYCNMLSAMIDEPVSAAEQLAEPGLPVLTTSAEWTIGRPELKLFDAQSNLYTSQESTLRAANRPKINLFVQGGIGKPGLNMLNDEMSPFYIAGARLMWNFGGFYTLRNNVAKLQISRQQVDVQKETFIFNTNLKLTQQNNEIDKLRAQIESDNEIVALRGNIKKSAEAKVENGTLTVTDLIREINAESMAEQDKALHHIQLLMAIYNLKFTANN